MVQYGASRIPLTQPPTQLPTPPPTLPPTPPPTNPYSGKIPSRFSVEVVPDNVQKSIHNLISTNPELGKDPATIQSLVNRYGISAEAVGNVLRTKQYQNVVGRGFFGSLWHGVGDLWNGLASSFAHDMAQSRENPNYLKIYNGVNSFSNQLPHALAQVPSDLYSLGKTIGSLPVGVVDPYGQNNGESNWLHAAKAASEIVNTPLTLMAGTLSDIKQNGLGYAAANLFPSLLIGKGLGLGVRALTGVEMSAGELAAAKQAAQVAADQATVEGAVGGMSFDQQVAASTAAQRLRVTDPVGYLRNQERLVQKNYLATPNASEILDQIRTKIAKTEEEIAKTQGKGAFDFSSKFNKSTNIFNKMGESIGKTAIGAPVNALRAFNRVMNSGTVTAAGLLRMPGIQSDPDMWKAALQGRVLDQNGDSHSVGEVLTTALQGTGFFHDIIAKVLDFDLAFVVNDPFSKALKLVGQAKSAAGFTGYLSKMWGGIGVSHIGDFTRSFSQYASVRRAVEYIASHDAGEINNRFRNMFNAPLLLKLGEARTTDAVLSVLEDSFAGVDYVAATAPTMSWYSVFKATLSGEIGMEFGTIGKLLMSGTMITRDIKDAVYKQIGLDIRPRNSLEQGMNSAGKSGAIMRRRIQAQFARTPEHFDRVMGKMTNRVITPCSVEAVNSIRDMMRANFQPETKINEVSNILIHSAGDANTYRRAYRSAMFDMTMDPLKGLMAPVEYEAVRNAMDDAVWEHLNRITGNDGGGMLGRYVATEVDWRDLLATPMGDTRAGIGNSHLGKLILPSARSMKQLQRQVMETAMELQSHAAQRELLRTDSDIKHLTELANFSEKTVEDVLAGMKKTLEEKRLSVKELWDTDVLYKGYKAKYNSLVKKYSVWLQEDSLKKLTRAEKVAVVFKDVEDETRKVTDQFLRLSDQITARLGVVPPGFEAAAEDLSTFAESLGMGETALTNAMQHLYGEKQALEDILANLHATFNQSFDSLNEIMSSAKQLAASTIENAEARATYLKAFKKRWDDKVDSIPGENVRFIGPALKPFGKIFFGKRQLRNNREMIVDLQQAYLNKYFKPMALSSPGWAIRVSTSEAMLNSFRIGGLNFFESHLAASIAKHDFKLMGSMRELEKLGKPEKMMLRNVVGGLMLGIERGALESIGHEQAGRLVNDAVDAMLDHDGHLPMSMDGHRDAVNGENMENYASSQVVGLDKDGKVATSNMYTTEGHTIIQANDSAAGTALHENVSRVFNDGILSVGARYLHNEARQTGTALFAANEETMMRRVLKEAVDRIENGPGKDAWAARNKFVDDLRTEVQGMAEFKMLNQEEQRQVLDLVNSNAKSVGDLVADDFPKYLRATYDAANRRITTIEESISRVESDIAEQTKLVAEYEENFKLSLLESSPTTGISIGEKLDEADARLRELGRTRESLDKEIIDHPFRQYYTSLESGAALAPYKPILNNLRQKMTEKVAEAQRDTESRIRELLGEQPVVLPQGGFADLSDQRMMTFKNAAGEQVPNEAAYLEMFNKHPELWSDNDSYKRWIPTGMPGVQGRDFLDALDGRASIEEVQKTVRYEQELHALHTALRGNKFKEAYAILDRLDGTSVSEIAPVLEAGSVDLSHASESFSVEGVSPELILGHGRTQEKTLADLALHVRSQNTAVPNMFSKSFFPNYEPTELGKIKFSADFQKHLDALTSKKATDAQKGAATKWFSKIVDPDPEKWATTANKVWKQNTDMLRSRLARDTRREEYYGLLGKRKDLSAQRSRIGVEKRQILRDSGLPDSPEGAANEAEESFVNAANRLDSLQAQRAMNDGKLAKAHEKRDDLERHVATQDTKYRDRLAKDANKMYKDRITKKSKGMGSLVRRIESRTATLNKTVEKTSRSVIDEVVSGLSSKGLSGDSLAGLRERLVDHMYAHLHSMPPEELARFPRSMFPNKYNSSGDPMLDWADNIAEHLMTLTSAKASKTFFPELAKQMAEGDAWGPQKMARWLSERVRNNEPHPTNFPARSYVPPLAAGSRSNVLTNLSEKMHTKFLGPIVNELVREPLFVWEYHQQMELLRVKVAQGLLTNDQAKVIGYTEATIKMNKYVHDPLGKTVWENNWRIAAPFYFAKNQAIRRALRVAGDDMSAFYKYMRLNLAITDYVAQSANGSNNFVVPGAELVGGLGAGVTSGIMYALGYRNLMSGIGAMNFGLDASPTSVMSIIITGTTSGLPNVARDMIGIPFAPTVTFPAKFVYQYLMHSNPLVERILTDLLGETAMRSSAIDDLVPNTFVRNAYKGAMGFIDQNNAGSYISTELYVIQDMAQQKLEEFYKQAQEAHPSLSSEELKRFGSKQQLWSFYANNMFSQYFQEDNGLRYAEFVKTANLRTAFLYSFKTIMSYSSPTAVSIGQRFLHNKEFEAIAKEKDTDGSLKFPTYFLQADEYSRRHPDRLLDLIGHTKSTGARWSSTAEARKFMENNYGIVNSFPNASAYLVADLGGKSDNRALQLEYALNLRKRETPKEFMNSLEVSLGNHYYRQMYDVLKADPSNIDPNTGGLNYKAGMQLRSMATAYGQTVNPIWLADKNSGRKNNVAYKTYNEMKQMIANKQNYKAFPPGAMDTYKSLIYLREQYEEAYNARVLNGEKTGALRSQWYDYCTKLADNPEWKQYAGFVTDVMRNLPNPQ